MVLESSANVKSSRLRHYRPCVVRRAVLKVAEISSGMGWIVRSLLTVRERPFDDLLTGL